MLLRINDRLILLKDFTSIKIIIDCVSEYKITKLYNNISKTRIVLGFIEKALQEDIKRWKKD